MSKKREKQQLMQLLLEIAISPLNTPEEREAFRAVMDMRGEAAKIFLQMTKQRLEQALKILD